MPKFEDKFVHFRWSDELEGKEVFYADDIPSLRMDVTNNVAKGIVTFSGYGESPFVVNGRSYDKAYSWRFVYYDPNYETKLAYEKGKKIEYKSKGDDWNYTSDPEWLDGYEYRIQPEGTNPVTNRELAKWLGMGNGEYKLNVGYMSGCLSEYVYQDNNANEPTTITCVRKWDDTEWHEPTREYLGL